MIPGEIRYWIRWLPHLPNDNKNLLNDLKVEIPFFIHYLIQRPFSTQPTTRMWFRADQLATPALKRVKRYNRNKLEVEMAQLLLSIIDIKESVEELHFSLSDMQDWLARKGFRGYETGAIKNVLQSMWQLKPATNSLAYLQYKFGADGTINEFNTKGRFYTISQKEVYKLNNLYDFDAGSISN